MTDIQDEAYSEAMDEIQRLKAEAAHWTDMAAQADVSCIAANAEIARLKAENEQYSEIITGLRERAREHQKLLTRAAEALEGKPVYDALANYHLIQELRDAAR
jgi:predicted CopG family antitoxin